MSAEVVGPEAVTVVVRNARDGLYSLSYAMTTSGNYSVKLSIDGYVIPAAQV